MLALLRGKIKKFTPNHWKKNTKIDLWTDWGKFFVCFWRVSPPWATTTSFMRFLDHTWLTTVGRTTLDEWSARRSLLYLTTHNKIDRHLCPWWDSNPQPQQASGRKPMA
jgi:hypothetical protein